MEGAVERSEEEAQEEEKEVRRGAAAAVTKTMCGPLSLKYLLSGL